MNTSTDTESANSSKAKEFPMTNIFKNAALALVAPGLLVTAIPAAQARDYDQGNYGWRNQGNYNGGYGYQSGYNGGYNNRYDEPVYRNTRTWRGDDGRYYCRRSDGTTGLIIGGAVGGLIGNEVAGRRGDKTLGVILGAGIGALAGRAIDRSGSSCR
jgi:Glycine zipper 2TM domain